MGICRARIRSPWWNSRDAFPSKCPSIAPAELGWYFGSLEDNPSGGCPRNIWGGMSRYNATPLIVASSPRHSDITRSCPWSPIARGNHLDRSDKKNFQMLLRRPARLTFLFCIQAFRDPFRGELPYVQIHHEWRTHPLTLDVRLLSYGFRRNPAVFKD